MRKLNLAFLARLLALVAVLGGGVHFAHGYMVRRNARALKDWAVSAEAASDLKKAQNCLTEYLHLKGEDGEAWGSYARIVDRADRNHAKREQVLLVYEEALRHNPGNQEIERRCADLALGLRRYTDASRHLENLMAQLSPAPEGRSNAAELAELLDLEGQCAQGLTQFDQAERLFVRAIASDPRLVACYDRLARLRRVDLRRLESASATIGEMVGKNPESGLAYIYRWRFNREFGSVDASDIEKGVKFAPDDPEVLLAAAIASEEKSDEAAARAYYEKGFKLDPQNRELATGLARIESRENHLDRAEAVLREALELNPSVTLAFYLAENLIAQGKIDGKGHAGDYITLLRNAGLGDTLVKYLEAQIAFKAEDWAEAKEKVEVAKALLASQPKLIVQLNLMLAECYRQLGNDEQRLDCLQQAAAGDPDHDSARVILSQELENMARSGNINRALRILFPLAERQAEWRLELARLMFQRVLRQPRSDRNWQEVDRYLQYAETARGADVEELALLRVDTLVAQDRLDDGGALLSAMQAKEPRNLRYRLARARLAQWQRKAAAALNILDRAEKDLGPSPDLQVARLEYWGRAGGAEAIAAVAQLAELRTQFPPAKRREFLARLAAVELRHGDMSLARRYWRELAALEPRNTDVRLLLVGIALAVGDAADAADLVKEIRAADGENGVAGKFARAEILIDGMRRRGADQKDLDEARKLAADIAQRRPRWDNRFVLGGEIAELAGSPDHAIENYQRAIELGNFQPALVRRLVRLLDQRKRFGEIERLAESLRNQEIARSAVTIARDLERQYLTDFMEIWIRRNRLDQLDRWLLELKKADPQGLLALQLEARLLDVRRRRADLLALLQARGRELPDQIGGVAELLDRYGFIREAEDAYKAFVARDPKQPERPLALAKFLVRQDRLAEAFPIFQRSWSTCPPAQVAAAALILYDARSVNDAQRRQVADWVSEAVEKHPEEVFLTVKLAIIRVRQGRYDEAETLFRRLLSRDPTNSEALNDLAWLLVVRNRAKAAEAIALVDRAVAISGEAPNLADTRAVARIQLGQFDRAVTELLALRKKSPENPSFALHLAWAYHASGQSEEARRELEAADKLGLRPGTLDPLELGVLERLRKM